MAVRFFPMLVRTFLTGQFTDIEKTKHEMPDRVWRPQREDDLDFGEETPRASSIRTAASTTRASTTAACRGT